MKEKIYIYSDIFSQDFIQNILFDYDIHVLSKEFFSDVNFKNYNVIFIIKDEAKSKIYQSFLLNNNVIILYSKKKSEFSEKKYNQTKIIYGPIKIKQFFDYVKTCFFFKTVSYNDIEISEQKIINLNLDLSCLLTPIETKIMFEFIEKKEIKRDYFLESIFNIKKNIETKTIESHLTRIRKKLLTIKSKTKISSREDTFYLES